MAGFLAETYSCRKSPGQLGLEEVRVHPNLVDVFDGLEQPKGEFERECLDDCRLYVEVVFGESGEVDFARSQVYLGITYFPPKRGKRAKIELHPLSRTAKEEKAIILTEWGRQREMGKRLPERFTAFGLGNRERTLVDGCDSQEMDELEGLLMVA